MEARRLEWKMRGKRIAIGDYNMHLIYFKSIDLMMAEYTVDRTKTICLFSSCPEADLEYWNWILCIVQCDIQDGETVPTQYDMRVEPFQK